MNIRIKTIIAALGAAALFALPALASAERIYFLVGTRHVYEIGPNRDSHWQERQRIEEDYADKVAEYQGDYDQRLAQGADPAAESDLLNDGLDDAARARDSRLGEFFQLRDDIRDSHPELQIECDGPYQVMAINFHRRQTEWIFDSYCVYAPWPGYVVVDRPYGWTYGVVYQPVEFTRVYVGWHRTYVSEGRPVFFGFVGHAGIEIHVSLCFGSSYSYGSRPVFVPVIRGPRGYRQAPPGYIPRVVTRTTTTTTTRYGRPVAPDRTGGRPGASRTRPGGGSFSRPTRTSGRPPTTDERGFVGGKTDAPRRPTGGSFGRPTGTSTPRTGGSFGRPKTDRTPGGAAESGSARARTTGGRGPTSEEDRTPSKPRTREKPDTGSAGDRSSSSHSSGSKPKDDKKKHGKD